MDTPGPTKTDLLLAANRLGRMLAEVGDFYDVVEDLIRGYAAGITSYPPSGGTSPSVEDSSKRLYIERQVTALVELRSVAENVLEWRVDDARDALMSWQEIADAVGISRQAAHKRYANRMDITDYPPL